MTEHESGHDRSEAALEELIAAGLVELRTDGDGNVTIRLTSEGARLARALASAGATVDAEALLELLLATEAPAVGEVHASPIEPLTMKGSFGTTLGSAMLGFEQALRSEPPPEVLAAEHMPERGYSGDGNTVHIGFPADDVDV
jgi:hypothetical protein